MPDATVPLAETEIADYFEPDECELPLAMLGFTGHETLSTLPLPVRAACNPLVSAAGAGLFVSGWLLDPKRLVTGVFLRSTLGFDHRIDEAMVRLSRPDINDCFTPDPQFSDSLQPWDTRHGFMAFVARAEPLQLDEAFYIEIVLKDESSAFLPLRVHDGDPQTLFHHSLGTVNADDPETDRLIADHLSPMVAALAANRSRRNQAALTVPFGGKRAAPTVSVVVPLTDGWDDFDVNLAHFGADPDFAAAELIIVAARPAADNLAARLGQCARFYGLSGRLVVSGAPTDAHEALELGVGEAACERVLLISPSVFPRATGWLSSLSQEFDFLPPGSALCPTLLYEDHSIRFAGTPAPEDGGTCGAGDAAGYVAGWIDATETAPVRAGTLDCCLLARSTFQVLRGFSSEYFGAEPKSLDFASRLKAAGGQFYWAPNVTLYGLDPCRSREEAPWMKVRRRIDEHMFARTWGDFLPTAARR